MFYLLYKIYSSFSRGERAAFISALVACALSGAFVGANAYYGATREEGVAGGAYTEGIVGQPSFINPLIANGNDADYAVIELVFANLKDLVRSHTVSVDRKTWGITLKQGLAWSDGKKLTADDVVFTIETIQDPNARSPLAITWAGIIVEKINDDEVRFTLKTPYAFFEDNLNALKIMPAHLWGAIPAANLRLSEYNLEPVGSGPYAFKDIATEKDGFVSRVTLVPNKHYYGAEPFLQKFIINFYRNEQTAIHDFNVRNIDGLAGIDAESARELTIGHRLIAFSLPRYYALFFNPDAHQALKEKKVRQALGAAIDRTALIENLFKGAAAVVPGPIPPVVPGFDPSVYPAPKEHSANEEEARALLEETGWLLDPHDNLRHKTLGKERIALQFNLVVPDIPFLVTAADMIKKDFADIGAGARLNIMAVDDASKEAVKPRNYDMIIFGNALKNNPDVFAFWHSSQKFYPGLNLALYTNKKADAILEGLREESDADARRAKIHDLEQLIFDDAPAAFLFNPAYLYAIPENLHGFAAPTIAAPAERFAGAGGWYLKTKRRLAQ